MRILLRDRKTNSTALEFSVVWNQVRAGFHASSGAVVENVDAALQLLTDSKPSRVLMAQVRKPFSYRNGREGQAYNGRRPDVDEMSVAELCQEVSERRNTIYQLRKNMEPNKRQRQSNWQGGRRGQDPQSTEQPGPKEVRVPEGNAKGPEVPSLSRSRPPRFKLTCCGPAGDHPTQMRSCCTKGPFWLDAERTSGSRPSPWVRRTTRIWIRKWTLLLT